MRTTIMRLLCLCALVSAVLAVAACGGSSKPKPAPGSPERPLVAEETRLGGGGSEASSARQAAQPGYESLVKKQSSHPRTRFTPCNLVTAEQARSIVGAPMLEPVEAAQGPTCIYRSRDGRSFVTVSVAPMDFGKVKAQLNRPHRIDVASRTAYCGTHGQPMLYVPFRDGRVLSISGQCPVAKRFAAKAVKQLTA
jgi:Protein of unknown function (DUF3558)